MKLRIEIPNPHEYINTLRAAQAHHFDYPACGNFSGPRTDYRPRGCSVHEAGWKLAELADAIEAAVEQGGE